MTECFESARLVMRPLSVDDAEALHEAYRDAELMHWWSSGPHESLNETREYIAPRLDTPSWRSWAITLKGDDRAIGTLAAHECRAGVAEIGYLVARPHWRRGIAREAVSRLIDLLILHEGHRRVCADTDPENVASIALLESLGFQREGVLRAEWETHIGVRDSLILGLLRDEWLEHRAAA